MAKLLLILIFFVADKVLAGERCETPKNETGVCIPLRSCQKLEEIARKPVSAENKKILLESRCGMQENFVLVCCPLKEKHDHLILYEPCTTPDQLDGNCQPFKTCPKLFNIFKQKPVSERNQNFLKNSKCREVDNIIYVCCPDPLKMTTTRPPTTPFPITSTTEHPENKSCIDSDQNRGNCVKVKSCPKIYKILQSKPVSPKNREYLRNNQCGFANGKPFVCCSQELTPKKKLIIKVNDTIVPEAEPEWLKNLKEKLPQPPFCGPDSHDRIFGGEETEVNQFPWAVLLQFNKSRNKQGFHCGGSLINDKYVLTAAHCVKKIPPSWDLISVRINEWNLTSEKDCSRDDETFCLPPVKDIKIAEKIVYKDYRPQSINQHFDIAILKLEESVEFGEFLKPICLPLDLKLRKKDYTSQNFEVAGWGRTETKTKSDVKLKVRVPFKEHEECRDIYQKQGKDIKDERQICAGGEKGKDSCNGDSGGPLMSYNVDGIPYWYLSGIVSYGPNDCGAHGVPGVYTKVSYFLEWISTILN